MRGKTIVWYRCGESESYFQLAAINDLNPASYRFIAQEAAEDYHSNHDGWESSWPMEFSLHATKGGPELARFCVERDMEPVFYAVKVKAKDAEAR